MPSRRRSRPVEGTPALRAMLRDKGFKTKHERGVELWKMFHETYTVLRAIGAEIDANESEVDDAD